MVFLKYLYVRIVHFVEQKWKLVFITCDRWRCVVWNFGVNSKILSYYVINSLKWVSYDCLSVWMLYKNNMYLFILKTKLYFLLSRWLIQWCMSFEYYLRHNFKDRNLHFLIFMHDKAWIVSVWCGPTPIILCSCMCNLCV